MSAAGVLPRDSRRARRGVALLVAQCALVLACLAAEFPSLWAERWVQDDAYVSFRYARNLVRGNGLVYNVGEPVEGYTNFLWTALAAVPLAAGAEDPLPFIHVVSAVLWCATYALLLGLTILLWNAGIWAAPLAVLGLALQWSFNMWFLSGMETPLVTMLTIAAVGAATLDPRRHAWAPLTMSACAVALMMTRPDAAVVLAALLVATLLLDGAWILRTRQWRRSVLGPLLPIACVWLPYQAWRIWYYGAFFPNTYYTKVAYLTYYARGWLYLSVYARTYFLSPFAAVALAGAVLVRPGTARRFLWTALLSSAAVVFYVVRLGGDFMEWRFVTPVTGVFYPAVVVGATVLGDQIARWRRATVERRSWFGWCAGAVTAAVLAACTRLGMPEAQTYSFPDQETIASLRRYTDPGHYDWRTAAHLCNEVLPAGVRIATTSAGIIPYFCDRPCLDLHGLTDPAIARMPVDPQKRGRLGHEHWLQDYGQVRLRGVDVVMEWVDPNGYPRAVATPPEGGQELISAQLPDGRFIDFTVLNPAILPEIHDPRVVRFDAAKIADRDRLQVLVGTLSEAVVIDTLDWGNGSSEHAHHFEEHEPADAPYQESWHTKLLRYLAPLDNVQVEDNGRRIWGSAQWQISNVSSASDLIMIGRHDYTGAARFAVEVNGRATPDPLITPGRPDEWWGEVSVRIPKALLADGTNTIRIARQPDSERDAEWYYMWFLQTPQPAVVSAGGPNP